MNFLFFSFIFCGTGILLLFGINYYFAQHSIFATTLIWMMMLVNKQFYFTSFFFVLTSLKFLQLNYGFRNKLFSNQKNCAVADLCATKTSHMRYIEWYGFGFLFLIFNNNFHQIFCFGFVENIFLSRTELKYQIIWDGVVVE